ncbi:hypothetical protein [Algihabitans albus]|uniref:hypothetical protein n=1 Tax=Algihabitans albus TaxID=2164067 RepID=UPI0013C35663|nr:hypothetical protein [Algihabitans albus]
MRGVDRLASRFGIWLWNGRRRLGLYLWSGLLVAGLVGLAVNGVALIAAKLADADIRALATGRDVAVEPDAAPALLHARTLHLLSRDRITEAEVLGVRLVRAGVPELEAGYRLTLGNARLRRAFTLIETARLNEAIPEVALAKVAYRAALAADPGRYDAKVNLDISMRLVRDLPRGDGDETGDPEARPRRVWTDLPGLPRGGP